MYESKLNDRLRHLPVTQPKFDKAEGAGNADREVSLPAPGLHSDSRQAKGIQRNTKEVFSEQLPLKIAVCVSLYNKHSTFC